MTINLLEIVVKIKSQQIQNLFISMFFNLYVTKACSIFRIQVIAHQLSCKALEYIHHIYTDTRF